MSTHIETAQDFRNAVAAGADEINHMPGVRPEDKDFTIYTSGRGRITDADARAAADPAVADEASRNAMLDTIKQNLLTFKRNHVHVAVGSDDYRNGVMPEVMSLHLLGIYTNAELLQMWTEETAATIFPHRKIGKLRPGLREGWSVSRAEVALHFASRYWPRFGTGTSVFSNRDGSGSLRKIVGPAMR